VQQELCRDEINDFAADVSYEDTLLPHDVAADAKHEVATDCTADRQKQHRQMIASQNPRRYVGSLVAAVM
jgi:hypothetical protein